MSYQIDNAHSQIQFTVRHMMISKVRGWFENFSGTVDLDEENPANTTVDIQIEAASINTREEKRDGHKSDGAMSFCEPRSCRLQLSS